MTLFGLHRRFRENCYRFPRVCLIVAVLLLADFAETLIQVGLASRSFMSGLLAAAATLNVEIITAFLLALVVLNSPEAVAYAENLAARILGALENMGTPAPKIAEDGPDMNYDGVVDYEDSYESFAKDYDSFDYSSDDGQSAAEYAIMLAVIGGVVMAVIALIGGGVGHIFSSIGSQMGTIGQGPVQ